MLPSDVPKPPTKNKSPSTKMEIDLTELKSEDFAPVKRERIGKGLAKLATLSRAKK